MSERIARRLKTLERYSRSEQSQIEALARSKADVVWFVNNWCWTYDPRNAAKGLPAYIPFDCWPKQVEFLRWLTEQFEQGNNCLAEKSRDAGLTYLTVYWCLHRWLFYDGFKATFGSRKLELVDKKNDPDAIFSKARVTLDRLPSWFLPPDFKRRDHDLLYRLTNPQRQSIITGEGGDNIGRGGRSSFLCIDEHAKIDEAESVEKAISNNADCILYLSTPVPGTLFAKKRFSGNYPIFTIHWTDDPRKDEAWYADQLRKYDAVTIAQEIDLDYSASEEEVVIPAIWAQAAVGLRLDYSGQRIGGLDVGGSGANPSVFLGREGPNVFFGEEWTGTNTTETARQGWSFCQQHRISILCYDRLGVGEGVTAAFEESSVSDDPIMHDVIERQWRTRVKAGSPLGPPMMPRVERPDERVRTRVVGVHVGLRATPDFLPDDDEYTAYDRFLNLRAQLYWSLRLRFERTYEYVMGVREWPVETLIAIPEHMGALIGQLSLPRVKRTGGRIAIESKREMRRRGVDSPDWLDALMLTEADFLADHVLVGRL